MDDSTPAPSTWPLWPGALIATLCGALLYYLSAFPYMFPGRSASSMAQHLGSSPFHPLQEPVWGWFARLLTEGSTTPWTHLNHASGLCAAICLGLVYLIAGSIPHDRSTEEFVRLEQQPRWLPHLCGAFAAGWLAVCTSFWFAATRATPLTLALVLLLVCVFCLVIAWRRQNLWPVYVACLLYGVGLTEAPAFLALLPFFVIGALNALHQRYSGFRLLPILLMAGLGLLGLSVLLLAGRHLSDHPSASWMYVSGYWDAVSKMVTNQLLRLKASVPRIGWLTLGLSTLLPGLIVLLPKRVARLSMLGPSMILHLLCGVIGLLILYNGFVSPWRLFRSSPLFLTPLVFASIWIGYLAGYGWLVLLPRKRLEGWTRPLRRGLQAIYPLLLLGLIVGAGWRGLPDVMPKGGHEFEAQVQRICEDLGERNWLVSNTGVEDVFRLEARRTGRELIVLNPALGGADTYRQYLKSLFTDLRLQSLANISVNTLLAEWIRVEPTAREKLATLTHVDLWNLADLRPVPSGLVFISEADAAPDATAYLEQQRQSLSRMDLPIARDAVENGRGAIQRFHHWLLRHHGKVANNTGVYLQQLDHSELAGEFYEQAVDFDGRNLSALMNLGNLQPSNQTWMARIDEIVGDRESPPNVWALGYYFGFIHDPGAYLDRGMAWALSGKPRLAAREMERALLLVQDNRTIRLELAAAYFAADDLDDSQAAYETLLADNPNDVPAILGLARLAILRHDLDTVAALTDRLRALNMPPTEIFLMQGGLAVLNGDDEVAMDLFEKVTDLAPNEARAWAGVAMLAQKQGDKDLLRRATDNLGAIDDLPPSFLRVHAQLLIAQGRRDKARMVYEALLRRQPRDVLALEALLKLDLREQEPRAATSIRVRTLLSIEPQNAYGNYVRGVLQHMAAQNELAEQSLEVSIQTKPTAEALNALAWVRWSSGQVEQALGPARDAVAMAPNNAPGWDTLGVVQRALGMAEDAERSLQRSLELNPANGAAMLHLAQAYADLGKDEEARKLLRDLNPMRSRLDNVFQLEMLELERALKSASQP